MFTTQEYVIGWLVYLVAGLVFFACWWYLTAKIKLLEVRAVLRTGALITMFTPWYASPDLDFVAPAVVIAGVEGIFEGTFWRAGAPLLAALGVGIIITLIYAMVRRVKSGRVRQTSEAEAT